jgi:hypothetical protein
MDFCKDEIRFEWFGFGSSLSLYVLTVYVDTRIMLLLRVNKREKLSPMKRKREREKKTFVNRFREVKVVGSSFFTRWTAYATVKTTGS